MTHLPYVIDTLYNTTTLNLYVNFETCINSYILINSNIYVNFEKDRFISNDLTIANDEDLEIL